MSVTAPINESSPGLSAEKNKDTEPSGEVKALRAEAEKHRKEATELKAWRAEREAKDAEAQRQQADVEAKKKADDEAKQRDELLKAQKFDELMSQERAEREKLKADFDKQLEERDAAIKAERRRALRVEVLARARELGMHEPNDITTFIRVADLKENEDGEIDGLDEKFADLKAKKPYLFKDEQSVREERRKALSAPPARSVNSLASGPDYKGMSTEQFRKEMAAQGVRI